MKNYTKIEETLNAFRKEKNWMGKVRLCISSCTMINSDTPFGKNLNRQLIVCDGLTPCLLLISAFLLTFHHLATRPTFIGRGLLQPTGSIVDTMSYQPPVGAMRILSTTALKGFPNKVSLLSAELV